jgi:hypothetical protein
MIAHSPLQQCSICKHEYTSTHVEVIPGINIFVCENCIEAAKHNFIWIINIFVCENCIEAAKHNFIWICMNCGKVYLRPKKLVMERVTDIEVKRAFLLHEDMQVIQGIDMCIDCDPEGLIDFMENAQVIAEC